MNDINLSARNTSNRRIYQRRNRKGNRTNITSVSLYPVTTTILTTNSTLLSESTPVPINDLFAWISSLAQHKYILGIILILFILLCVISIIFVLAILKCTKKDSWKKRRQAKLDKKRFENIPDFLDDHHKDENDILLEPTITSHSALPTTISSNGILPNDNISNTLSLDTMLVQKIYQNNPPNTSISTPIADDTSVDTLRGSLISSPSQQISAIQLPSTPIHPIPITTTDSVINVDEQVVATEKDDDLKDLDLERMRPRFIKTANNSSSNISAHRTSVSSIEQTIRKKEQRAEEEERELLHGSNSNIYEKTIREQNIGRQPHTNSQVSLVSRTSEDSCY